VTDSLVGQTTDRGFTMHEHLDEMGVVHMNGRIYDPLIGRFLSADPFIQVPGMLQSYNRYAYVMAKKGAWQKSGRTPLTRPGSGPGRPCIATSPFQFLILARVLCMRRSTTDCSVTYFPNLGLRRPQMQSLPPRLLVSSVMMFTVEPSHYCAQEAFPTDVTHVWRQNGIKHHYQVVAQNDMSGSLRVQGLL
jgi:RHS repeat-associated protein